MAHARDSIPDPTTAVIIWALAVVKVPSKFKNHAKKKMKSNPFLLESLCFHRKSKRYINIYIYIYILPVRFGRPSSSNLEVVSPDSVAKLRFPCISFSLTLSRKNNEKEIKLNTGFEKCICWQEINDLGKHMQMDMTRN
jgi:hypothetical protein